MQAQVMPTSVSAAPPGSPVVDGDHSRQFISFKRLIQYDGNQEFKTFKQKQDLNSTYTLYFFIFQNILNLWRCVDLYDDTGAPLPLRINIILRFIILLFLGVAYVYMSKKIAHSPFNQSDGTKLLNIGDALVISQAVLIGTMLLIWAFTIGDCDVRFCKADKNTIPMTQVIFMMGGSIANPIFYGCHSAKASLASIICIYVCIFVVAVQRNLLKLEIFAIAITGIVMFYTVAKLETQVVSNFVSYSKFESALLLKVASENEEYLMRTQTEEMRHMIGNVAHDLRTPLQAFQSEIELLQESLVKHDDDANPEKTQKYQLDSIKQLGLICHFMNMTINRSIDFTKASSGIKLNPAIESINFSDTMTWAVGCMVTTQGTVPIVLEPIPAAIHNHLYTDKQWLMENMLCLLSNAQKFTTEGAISIRCSLHAKLAAEGGVVQRSRHLGDTSSASEDSHNSSPLVGTPMKYSTRHQNNDNECSVRSPCELSSWRERVSDFVVDLEMGAHSSTAVTPINTEVSVPMLMIEIEDTGIGITKENRDKLFQPFAQAQHRTGGTGLGLYALSKRLESLGGNCGVDIRSDGASGSCFWISIPYRPDRSVSQSPSNRRLVRTLSPMGIRSPEQSVKHSNSEPQLVSSMFSGFISHDCDSADEQSVREQTGSRLHGLRILLVDDSALIRKATSRSLVNEGYLVEVARQGAECLKVLEASRAACKSGGYGFDVVLMDMQMPVMDGLEATRRIRAMEKAEAEAAVTWEVASGDGSGGGGNGGDRGNSTLSRHIKIIGVSAHTEGEARAECADCGMDSFIEKPLQMKHLRRCLLSMGVDVRNYVDENDETHCDVGEGMSVVAM